jgi:hypothetical protein
LLVLFAPGASRLRFFVVVDDHNHHRAIHVRFGKSVFVEPQHLASKAASMSDIIFMYLFTHSRFHVSLFALNPVVVDMPVRVICFHFFGISDLV